MVGTQMGWGVDIDVMGELGCVSYVAYVWEEGGGQKEKNGGNEVRKKKMEGKAP
jgi:hypothetical protein